MIILAATDFSTTANNAVNFAAHLAQTAGAELILFNVFKLNIHASNARTSSDHVEHMITERKNELNGLSEKLQGEFKITVSWEMGRDNTVDSLKEYTMTHWADLVVMGIDSNLLAYKMMGNTTTAAIHLMQFPLLVIPDHYQFHGFKKIMLACDMAYIREELDLSILRHFTKLFDSQLHIYHVFTNNTDRPNDEEMEKYMNGVLYDVDHTFGYVHNPKVGDGINTGLEEFPASLLVMIPHKLRFFEHLIKGSHTGHMTVRTQIPLLVIPNKRVM